MTVPEPVIVGIDPGSAKCGLAVLGPRGEVVRRAVVPRAATLSTLLDWLSTLAVRAVVIGDGTGSKPLRQELEAAGHWPVVTRPEYGTTLEARTRYWREHPPRGLWRLLPTSMRVPPEPFDDLVATILAERLWAEDEGIT